MTIQRLFLAFVIVVALAVAGHGIFWWSAAGEMRDGVAAWIEDRRAAGWTISHGKLMTGGYPLQVSADIDNPDIAGPGKPAKWRWQGDLLRLTVELMNPREILFSSAGAHRVHTNHGGRQEIVEAVVASAKGKGRPGRDGTTEAIVLDLDAVEAKRKGAPETLRIGRLGMTLFIPQRSGETAAMPADREPAGPFVSVSAEKILLPKEARYPLGRTIGKAAIEAKLIGDPAFGATPSQTLAAWRDAGGTLEVRSLDLVWGKFDLSGEGTVALDNALQPIVAMTARIKGYRETVDALVDTGWVQGRDAFATKMVLGVVARATPGGKSQLTVPLSLQQGVLSAGPARLLRVPAIDWDTGKVDKMKRPTPN